MATSSKPTSGFWKLIMALYPMTCASLTLLYYRFRSPTTRSTSPSHSKPLLYHMFRVRSARNVLEIAILADAAQGYATRIFDLPNEILEQIMGHLDGALALCVQLEVDSQAKLISQTRPRDILVVVIRNVNMACELQKLMCAGSTIRRHQIGGCLGINNLRLCLDTHLGNDFPYADHAFDESLLVLSPMALLHDCDHILSQIALAEASVISVQLLPIADKIRAAVVREDRHLSCQPEYLDQQPSQPNFTEFVEHYGGYVFISKPSAPLTGMKRIGTSGTCISKN